MSFRDDLSNLLDDVNLEIRQNLWFVYHVTSSYDAHIVRNWLNTNFPQRVIGTYGPAGCTARSLDLNPCIMLYEELSICRSDSIEQLRKWIDNAAETTCNNQSIIEPVKDSLIRCVRCLFIR